MSGQQYIGRFAPSPTGQLHFGSLVAALGSYLEARQKNGLWQLRIDDLDQTRCIEGMDRDLLDTLSAFGFVWDGVISYQSEHSEHYAATLQQLSTMGLTYACQCSRKQIAQHGVSGLEGPIYPGTCRKLGLSDSSGRSIRLAVDQQMISFDDACYGTQTQQLDTSIGDFVVRRADGLFAYQLAVVVDDHLSQVNHVVRGSDLLNSTARQCYLCDLLGFPRPSYLHLPLVTDPMGRKLSKSDADHPIDRQNPMPALLDAWRHLGQNMWPTKPQNVDQFWRLAVADWNAHQIPR